MRRVAERSLDLAPNSTSFDYVHLVCREREGVLAEAASHRLPEEKAASDSHPVHADNCYEDKQSSNGGCLRGPPMFHWRSHTAALFLGSGTAEDSQVDFGGGEFFFASDWAATPANRTLVIP